MKKSNCMMAIGLLAVSVAIPSGRGHADVDPPGNHEQREELREDMRDLRQLQRQRDRELRQGDFQDAREYNEKIREQQQEIRRDRRDMYRSDRGRDRDWRDSFWGWGRD